MFAGPNGSGKTSLVRKLAKEFSADGLFQLHRFLNADDMLSALNQGTGISFSALPQPPQLDELRAALINSQRIHPDHPFLAAMRIEGTELLAPSGSADGYVGAAIADFLREALLAANASFSFETVMSHPSKVDCLRRARARGYRTYLYFVATDSPDLNVLRVRTRIAQGEHAVPEQKIVE